MEYPRVLLIHMTRVHQNDPHNLIVRSLFGGWPTENLAQIYTGHYTGAGDFCGHYFEIGPRERRMGWLFYALKPKAVSALANQPVAQARVRNLDWRFWKSWGTKLASKLVMLGYWDVIFPVFPSNALWQFIREFKPQIIFTQGYSLSFTHLALDVARRLQIPICYFPMDDWHSYLYSNSLVHRRVEIMANEVAKRATLRFALGPKMAETFSARYGVPFECLYHADNLSRFAVSEPVKDISERSVTIAYVGSLYLGRLAVFKDLLSACDKLERSCKIDIYCPGIPPDAPAELLDSPKVSFLPLPNHNDLPRVLSQYDILFLPESFEPEYKSAIEFSLSTKAHLYMMIGKPILVYGPAWSGTVDYAKRFGWSIVVDEHGSQNLIKGLVIALNQGKDFVLYGYEIARQNHDIATLQKYVQQRICSKVGLI